MMIFQNQSCASLRLVALHRTRLSQPLQQLGEARQQTNHKLSEQDIESPIKLKNGSKSNEIS